MQGKRDLTYLKRNFLKPNGFFQLSKRNIKPNGLFSTIKRSLKPNGLFSAYKRPMADYWEAYEDNFEDMEDDTDMMDMIKREDKNFWAVRGKKDDDFWAVRGKRSKEGENDFWAVRGKRESPQETTTQQQIVPA